MEKKNYYKFLMVFLLMPFAVSAQITVTGTITDAATRETLPGVSVMIKGSQSGSTSDENGKYSLANVNSNATLVFSYLGYVTFEAPATANLNVA